MTVSRDQRSLAWNVEFVIGGTGRAAAGLYQRDDLLTVADVARDLDFCLVFPNAPTDHPAGQLQPALIPMTEGPSNIIILDKNDTAPFPTPAEGQKARYSYVLHCCCEKESEPHALADLCVLRPGTPKRRYQASYPRIGRTCEPALAGRVPSPKRRRSLKSTSASSASRDPSQQTSSAIDNDIDTPPTLIGNKEGAAIESVFRDNVLAACTKCAISGKGKPWLDGVPGTAIEAAHIVPRGHWRVYPLDDSMRIATGSNDDDLEMAWRSTWGLQNGIPMLSHLHRCFDDRQFSIHPRTMQIRAFIPYDLVTEYHGHRVSLPHIDPVALQHQWNMCCVENMVATWVVTGLPPQQGTNLTPALQSPVLVSSTPGSGVQPPQHSGVQPQMSRGESAPSNWRQAHDGQTRFTSYHSPPSSRGVSKAFPAEPAHGSGTRNVVRQKRKRRAAVRALDAKVTGNALPVFDIVPGEKAYWYGDHFVDEGEACDLLANGYGGIEEVDWAAWGIAVPESGGLEPWRERTTQWLESCSAGAETQNEAERGRTTKRKRTMATDEHGKVGDQAAGEVTKRQRLENLSPSPRSLVAARATRARS